MVCFQKKTYAILLRPRVVLFSYLAVILSAFGSVCVFDFEVGVLTLGHLGGFQIVALGIHELIPLADLGVFLDGVHVDGAQLFDAGPQLGDAAVGLGQALQLLLDFGSIIQFSVISDKKRINSIKSV